MSCEGLNNEHDFRLMANSAPVMIWLAGLDKGCNWFNQVWLDFTGNPMAQEIGDGWAKGVHPDDVAFCVDIYSQHFDWQQPFTMEYRLKRHDGEYRWILDNGTPRYDDTGAFIGYIGSCIDITQSKNMQSALETSHADLMRFAEASAHHLMEPTRRLISYSQHLRHRLGGIAQAVHDAEIQQYLNYLEQDGQRLRCLLRDIQLYLSADQPRGDIVEQAVEPVVQGVLQQLRDKIQRYAAVIDIADLPIVYIDRPRLADLFTLLIDNALIHGRPANSQISPHIRISGEADGKISRYRISDNGPGLAPKYCQRAFLLFERLHVEPNSNSTGIGLAIARRIVESCQGKIWLENLPQAGMMVVLELPNGAHCDHF